ncbi:Unknown protein [Striga hermonthica]|uniref:Myb/SANT-like domain-containing protein n=1 Tax=Striga hermonthica TaxID=68872 RepID=A0A9N7RNT5_STRHE|nr:Unknown protein [Striga hermonthica]
MRNIPEEYRGRGEYYFLKVMAEEIEKADYPPGATFSQESMLCVFRNFRSIFGPIFSDRCLKQKIKSLKKKYKDFSELLKEDNILWDKQNNIVYSNDELLSVKYKGRYKNGVFHGEPNYDLMCAVFERGINFE